MLTTASLPFVSTICLDTSYKISIDYDVPELMLNCERRIKFLDLIPRKQKEAKESNHFYMENRYSVFGGK